MCDHSLRPSTKLGCEGTFLEGSDFWPKISKDLGLFGRGGVTSILSMADRLAMIYTLTVPGVI